MSFAPYILGGLVGVVVSAHGHWRGRRHSWWVIDCSIVAAIVAWKVAA